MFPPVTLFNLINQHDHEAIITHMALRNHHKLLLTGKSLRKVWLWYREVMHDCKVLSQSLLMLGVLIGTLQWRMLSKSKQNIFSCQKWILYLLIVKRQ